MLETSANPPKKINIQKISYGHGRDPENEDNLIIFYGHGSEVKQTVPLHASFSPTLPRPSLKDSDSPVVSPLTLSPLIGSPASKKKIVKRTLETLVHDAKTEEELKKVIQEKNIQLGEDNKGIHNIIVVCDINIGDSGQAPRFFLFDHDYINEMETKLNVKFYCCYHSATPSIVKAGLDMRAEDQKEFIKVVDSTKLKETVAQIKDSIHSKSEKSMTSTSTDEKSNQFFPSNLKL